jgi:hypothetical protein
MKPTFLYIKQHTVTGLKYFGKTTERNPYAYLGSGKYWKKHISKHGIEHVITVWAQLFISEEELTQYAKNFSAENDIVNSSSWANLKEENGLDGGMEKGWWSDEQIENFKNKQKQRWKDGKVDAEKLKQSRIGFKQPQSQKDSVSKKLSLNWQVTSPAGVIMTITNLRKFCLENNLDQGNLSRGSYKGWKCSKICS